MRQVTIYYPDVSNQYIYSPIRRLRYSHNVHILMHPLTATRALILKCVYVEGCSTCCQCVYDWGYEESLCCCLSCLLFRWCWLSCCCLSCLLVVLLVAAVSEDYRLAQLAAWHNVASRADQGREAPITPCVSEAWLSVMVKVQVVHYPLTTPCPSIIESNNQYYWISPGNIILGSQQNYKLYVEQQSSKNNNP